MELYKIGIFFIRKIKIYRMLRKIVKSSDSKPQHGGAERVIASGGCGSPAVRDSGTDVVPLPGFPFRGIPQFTQQIACCSLLICSLFTVF